MNLQDLATEALQALQGWQPPAGLPPQLQALLLTPQGREAAVFLVAAGVLAIGMRPRAPVRVAARSRDEDEDVIARPGNTPALSWTWDWPPRVRPWDWEPGMSGRWWWRIRPPVDLMAVDGLVLDRSRKPHCAWLGPTGAGKSSAVAVVRVDGARGTLIVTPDISDPLIAAAKATSKWFHWRACEGPQPINFLIGSPTEVAERLTEVFRSGGTGAWKREVRMRVAAIVRDMDDEGVSRSLEEIGERLRELARKDKMLAQVAAGWIARFLDLADQLNGSIDDGGVDLAELLRDGYTVVIDNDAFEHPGLVEDIVSLGLSEAKRCAARCPKGFRLIFEEAGQLGDRIELAAPFFRAGRRRRICVDVLTQAESDLVYQGSDAITANLGTRVYFAQELKPLQRAAADRLGLKLLALDPATMADFTAWIAHGRVRRLVRFAKPPRTRPARGRTEKPGVKNDRPGAMRVWIVEKPGPEAQKTEIARPRDALRAKANGVYALPAASAELPSFVGGEYLDAKTRKRRSAIFAQFSGTWDGNGQWVWGGATNKGYGKTSYLGVSGVATHFLMWSWRVMEDRRLGRSGDLQVFYARHPEIPEFQWPELDDELVQLRALKQWMERPFGIDPRSVPRSDPRYAVQLSIDHKCPGFPNTLCGNTRHLWLATNSENSQWRHERRKGDGRLRIEAMG